MNWEKYVFCWEKWNLEPIINTVQTAKLLGLGEALHKNIDYLMYCPSLKRVK